MTSKGLIMDSENRITGNKGEWSEFYAFCRILAEGILKTADKDLNENPSVFLPVIDIIRQENKELTDYVPDKDSDSIQIYKGNKLISSIPKYEFEKMFSTIYSRISSGGGTGSMSIPETTEFMERISCMKIKADSVHKEDINIKIHDINTGQCPVQGFSIKSYIGNDPTLLNAGKTTNFRFELTGCSDEIMAKANSIDTREKIKDRMDLLQNACGFRFIKAECETFEKNLQLIDSSMPRIVADLLLINYKYGIIPLADATNLLEQYDPMFMDNNGFYEYKVKNMLRAVALGMIPSDPWKGEEDANGGYIVVKEDGNIVCFFLYNRNEFEDYLLNCTKFEKASTGRHEYMKVFKEKDKYFIDLNLQIRFVKPGFKPRNKPAVEFGSIKFE